MVVFAFDDENGQCKAVGVITWILKSDIRAPLIQILKAAYSVLKIL